MVVTLIHFWHDSFIWSATKRRTYVLTTMTVLPQTSQYTVRSLCMLHKKIPSLLLLTGPAILSSLLSCDSGAFSDEWPAPSDTCPAGVYVHRISPGRYRTPGAVGVQDTCNAGVTVDNLQHYQVEANGSGTYMVLISRVAGTSSTLFLGPVHCNVGSSMTMSESSTAGDCQYDRARSSTLTVTDKNTLEVHVNETWHNVTGAGCSGSEGCTVSYQVTLSP